MDRSHKPTPFLQKKRILSLWLFTATFLLLLVFSRSCVNEAGTLDIVLDYSGLLLVIAGIFGRLWSILYIGGRKNQQLVTAGPYAMTRNPLYFFSVVAVFGVSLTFGSALVAIATSLIAFSVFTFVARREADYLRHVFGAQYLSYAQVTPLFWPKVALLRSPSEIAVATGTLKSTFKDALFFLAAFPVMELLEYLHLHGYVSAFLEIP